MKKLLIALLVAPFVLTAYAEAPTAGSCEAKAISKDGKPLVGAAKTSSIKKCMAETK